MRSVGNPALLLRISALSHEKEYHDGMLRLMSCGIAAVALAAAQGPSFDVASVKPSQQTYLVLSPQRSGGRISWTTSLGLVIYYAYHLEPWQVSGDIADGVFAFEATTTPEATADQVREMFKTLLAQRFRMTSHTITKDVDGFALTVGRGGLKIKPAEDGAAPPPMPEWFAKLPATQLDGQVATTLEGKGIGALTARAVSMDKIAQALGRLERTFVTDQTGVSGKYYMAFKFARDNAPDDVDLPPLAVALQESTGLKLEKHKGPAQMLVVDHMDKMPSEN